MTIYTFLTRTDGSVYTLIETVTPSGVKVRHLIGKTNSPFVRMSIDHECLLYMEPPTVGKSFRTEFMDKNSGKVVPFWTSPVTLVYTLTK
jgi:hypothetical protein